LDYFEGFIKFKVKELREFNQKLIKLRNDPSKSQNYNLISAVKQEYLPFLNDLKSLELKSILDAILFPDISNKLDISNLDTLLDAHILNIDLRNKIISPAIRFSFYITATARVLNDKDRRFIGFEADKYIREIYEKSNIKASDLEENHLYIKASLIYFYNLYKISDKQFRSDIIAEFTTNLIQNLDYFANDIFFITTLAKLNEQASYKSDPQTISPSSEEVPFENYVNKLTNTLEDEKNQIVDLEIDFQKVLESKLLNLLRSSDQILKLSDINTIIESLLRMHFRLFTEYDSI
jgi:hypothetical protein